MSFEQRHAEIEFRGTRYKASTNPDGSVTYWKQSDAGYWYEVKRYGRDPWLRSVPPGVKQRLDEKLSQANPLASPTTELVVGGVASVVLIGLGVTMIYQALNPSGASTSDTLQNTAALTAIAGVV